MQGLVGGARQLVYELGKVSCIQYEGELEDPRSTYWAQLLGCLQGACDALEIGSGPPEIEPIQLALPSREVYWLRYQEAYWDKLLDHLEAFQYQTNLAETVNPRRLTPISEGGPVNKRVEYDQECLRILRLTKKEEFHQFQHLRKLLREPGGESPTFGDSQNPTSPESHQSPGLRSDLEALWHKFPCQPLKLATADLEIRHTFWFHQRPLGIRISPGPGGRGFYIVEAPTEEGSRSTQNVVGHTVNERPIMDESFTSIEHLLRTQSLPFSIGVYMP